MCEKCDAIDGKIARCKRIADHITDQMAIDGIAKLIVELTAEKAALHPEQLPKAHSNERVELAMKILACRRRLRLFARNDQIVEKIRIEIALLEEQLRVIDE